MCERLNLDEVEARCSAATPGPWSADLEGQQVWQMANKDSGFKIVDIRGWGFLIGTARMTVDEAVAAQDANTLFIAHARADIPALVARVRELEADNEALRIQLAQAERERDALVEWRERVVQAAENNDIDHMAERIIYWGLPPEWAEDLGAIGDAIDAPLASQDDESQVKLLMSGCSQTTGCKLHDPLGDMPTDLRAMTTEQLLAESVSPDPETWALAGELVKDVASHPQATNSVASQNSTKSRPWPDADADAAAADEAQAQPRGEE